MTGNTFDHNQRDIFVQTLEFPGGFSTEETTIDLVFADNTYIGHHRTDVEVNFQSDGIPVYAANTSVIVLDVDGVFPNPAEVDLGPVENGNEYLLKP